MIITILWNFDPNEFFAKIWIYFKKLWKIKSPYNNNSARLISKLSSTIFYAFVVGEKSLKVAGNFFLGVVGTLKIPMVHRNHGDSSFATADHKIAVIRFF